LESKGIQLEVDDGEGLAMRLCRARRWAQMVGHGQKLSRKKEQAIAALLSQRGIDEAARAAGIGSTTLRRWLRLPEFQAEYLQARRDVVHQAHARIQQNAGAAAAVLLKLMADPTTPASVRVRAAECVLNQATKALEIEDLEARVTEFERDALGRHMGDAGVECPMRHTLVSRLERLESQRTGAHFKTLPVDSVGERHVVIVEQERTCSELEVCQCEEQPGPAPPGLEDPGCHIYFREEDPSP
jgi:hypothetical protein